MEVASDKTHEADAETKPQVYALAQVTEYWLYDPSGYTGLAPLCGWRLVQGIHEEICPVNAEVAGERIMLFASEVLGTQWGVCTGPELRLRNPAVPDAWYQADAAALLQAEARAHQAEAKARQALQEQARITTEIARL